MQTHPTVLALVPGAALFLIWKRRPLLRTRWAALAAGLALLVNLNLLVYNLATGFDSFVYGGTVADDYAQGQPLTPTVYLVRMGMLMVGLARFLGGRVTPQQSGSEWLILLDPGLWPMTLLAVAGLVWQWRRGNPLPGLLLISLALLFPLVNFDFRPIVKGRYLVPLMLVLYAGVAAILNDAFKSTLRLTSWSADLGRIGQLGLGLVTLLVVLHPLLYLRDYYQGRRRTNAPFYQTVERVRAIRTDEVVLIDDREPPQGDPAPGYGWGARALGLLLAIADVPHRLVDLSSDEPVDLRQGCGDQLVVLPTRELEANQSIVTRLDLQSVRITGRALVQYPAYPLYRVRRLPDPPESC